MTETVKIVCENTGKSLYVEMGKPIADVLKMVKVETSQEPLAAYVNNRIRELNYRIFKPLSVRFIDITHFEGIRVYHRTLFFILNKAVFDIFPDKKLRIKHAIAKGFYCEIENVDNISENDVHRIHTRMDELIAQNIPIVAEKMLSTEAEEIYSEFGFDDKVRLITTRPSLYVDLYRIADLPGYFYGALAPSTGYVKLFDLRKYLNGMYLAAPQRVSPDKLEPMIPQNKMFDLFSAYKDWVEIIGVSDIGSLNSQIIEGNSGEIIKVSESLHEKNIAFLADVVSERHRNQNMRVVLISGPSSSGKTTFGKRLSIQMRVMGLIPVMISMDNYFVDRDKTPLDSNGERDFESLESVDVEQLNKDLSALLAGEEVFLPKYDFQTGKSIPHIYRTKLDDRSVIIIEGIHALNPRLTHSVDDAFKYKIYTSALTSVSMDDLTRISTTDNRLLRRIVRDHKYRGSTATDTIRRWQSVRRGEDKHIFPFQEQADVMFNSSMVYEICVLKAYAEPLLYDVPDTVPEYAEAKRLMDFLNYFIPISDNELPPTSILREFVGGSSFNYD